MDLKKIKDADKKTYKTKEFNIEDFLRALDKVVELNNNNIQFYTLENSIKILGYPRSFRADYTAISSLYRGTRTDKKYEYLKKYLTEDVVKKLDGITSRKPNTTVRFAKKLTTINIDEFIQAYNYFKTLSEGPYYSYDLAKSKRLLGYNMSFGNVYSTLVSQINGSENHEYLKRLLTQENMQKLAGCGFLDDLRKASVFNGELFAKTCSAILSNIGKEGFASSVDDYMVRRKIYDKLVPEVQAYPRNFEDDFRDVTNILVGSSKKYNPIYYTELTSEVESQVYMFAVGKNAKITKPFNMQEFLALTEFAFSKGVSYVTGTSKKIQSKILKDYGRDYALDCFLVKKALEGELSPAYITKTLTKNAKIRLKNVGFGESSQLDIDDFIRAWNNFLEVKYFEPNCSYLDFDKDLSLEVLDYNRDFSQDYAYFAEVALNKGSDKKVSKVAQKFDTDECRQKLIKAHFAILDDYAKLKRLGKKNNNSKVREG